MGQKNNLHSSKLCDVSYTTNLLQTNHLISKSQILGQKSNFLLTHILAYANHI